jgi:hypothetical protein
MQNLENNRHTWILLPVYQLIEYKLTVNTFTFYVFPHIICTVASFISVYSS